jgi:hypothetical protein
MTCQDRDADLLLLSHGELGLAARTRTRFHVRGCRRCRRRIAEFNVVSAALAQVLTPTGGERLGRKNPKPAVAAGSMLTIAGLLLVIGVSLYMAGRAILPEIVSSGTYYYYNNNRMDFPAAMRSSPASCETAPAIAKRTASRSAR